MKTMYMRWLVRAASFAFFYLIVGTVVGRWFWSFTEHEIDPEKLRVVVELVGLSVGLKSITSLDSRLDAIERIVDYLTFPWALLGGLCGMLAIEIIARAPVPKRSKQSKL